MVEKMIFIKNKIEEPKIKTFLGDLFDTEFDSLESEKENGKLFFQILSYANEFSTLLTLIDTSEKPILSNELDIALSISEYFETDTLIELDSSHFGKTYCLVSSVGKLTLVNIEEQEDGLNVIE